MRKRKIAFIDHRAHAMTGSSTFFRILLEERFAIELLYVSPDFPIGRDLVDAAIRCDIVVVWQMDFLAPIFISKGIPTVVVLMFDGSANMPDLHWIWAKQASFICFSWTMYDRLRVLGCRVYLTRYFVEPLPEARLPIFDDYNLFLWQRRPEEGIHGDMVVRLLGDQIDTMHIHDVPDNPNIRGSDYYGLARRFNPTVSHWFANQNQYEDQLLRANIFIAPRRAEGIGMAHLEAMAHGMLVLAHDQPTHTEYLANWVNGVLFNADNIGLANIPRDVARTMARSGWLTAVEGRREWDDMRSNLLNFVEDAYPPSQIETGLFDSIVLSLPHVYQSGLHHYANYLESHRKTIMAMAGSSKEYSEPMLNTGDGEAPTLRGRTITFSSGQGRPYMLNGWSHDESEAVWIAGRAADIAFRWPEPESTLQTMAIICRAISGTERPLKVIVTFNDEIVGTFHAGKNWTKCVMHGFAINTRYDNRLSIYLNQSVPVPKDGRELSLMVQAIVFNSALDEV